MKVLMTQRALVNWAGTEMFTIEVANELAKRGHDVAVFSPRVGFPASLMIPSGVWVKSRLNELPWPPDVIHGQHHLQAHALLCAQERGWALVTDDSDQYAGVDRSGVEVERLP